MTDPTPTRDEAVRRDEQLRIQAVGAAISRRDWHAVEQAYNAIRDEFDRRPLASAPAPASGGVDAVLNLYREAVRVDVKMEGPQFMGANSSALKRAWEADRASLSPAATPVSEAEGEVERLKAVLRNVRHAILEGAKGENAVVTCTLWMPGEMIAETVVDHITAALGDSHD